MSEQLATLYEKARHMDNLLIITKEQAAVTAAHLRRLAALDEAGGGRAYTLMLEQRLKEEADRLAALEQERAEARAAHDRCFSDCVALQRENTRLRTKLLVISMVTPVGDAACQEIAAEALEPVEGGDG